MAPVPDLIALKVLARDDRTRPQDAQDLRALLDEAKPVDLEQARAALQLVTVRGCARGKDLGLELDRAIRDFGPAETP